MPRNATLLEFGVPFPRGLFFNPRKLTTVTDQGAVLASDIATTVLWPDNSIKWCLVRTRVKLDGNEALPLRITEHSGAGDSYRCKSGLITETESEIRVQTRNCLFELDKKKFQFLQKVRRHGEQIAGSGFCTLKTDAFGHLDPEITGYRHHTAYLSACPVSCELRIAGCFRAANGDPVANFDAKLTFLTEADQLKCEYTLHNPKAARHTSGLWDLGDPNSLLFQGLELGLTLSDTAEINWKTDRNNSWTTLLHQPLTIYQESSGGPHWNSPNHKDRTNRIPYTLNGFICSSGAAALHSGKRSSPALQLRTDSGRVSVFVEKFWQNCPKSLEIENNQIRIGLFPGQFAGEFELQPGEKKTHTFYFDFSDNPAAIEHIQSPIEVTLNPAWIQKSGVLPHFDTDVSNDPLHPVINEGLDGDRSFFAKREMVDEYGWRNFGDLYADHETEGYEGDDIFISHYNNQYDLIYGFLRQYALTGEHQWLALADDLASHVIDIDLYHTRLDKDEYNGGLFWHTDHYVDAATSTHRSYSKLQKSDAYIGHAGGGGPGGQHCYTTGLLYHYLITGNESSRNAVFQLTDWVTRVYEGSGTLLSVLLSIKNQRRVGSKNISTGKYPMDRGTANYITALLDKFTLTQERTSLDRVEHIIRNTVHPLDNITARNLIDVEANWFYTVFLQAVCRYLQTKEELADLDDCFYYARDSLLHYADWMAQHEYPYLEKPGILEFPNHTWTAQDLRKVNILLFADYYSPVPSPAYRTKAEEIYSYIADTLPAEDSRCYTRILAILMQNHGAMAYFGNLRKRTPFQAAKSYPPAKDATWFSATRNITGALLSAVKAFSPKQELLWLARRSNIVNRLLGLKP